MKSLHTMHHPSKTGPHGSQVYEEEWENHPYASLYEHVMSAQDDTTTTNNNNNTEYRPETVLSNAMNVNVNINMNLPTMVTSMGFSSEDLAVPATGPDSPAMVTPSSSSSETGNKEGEADVITLLWRDDFDVNINNLGLEGDDQEEDDQDDDDDVSVETINSIETIEFSVPIPVESASDAPSLSKKRAQNTTSAVLPSSPTKRIKLAAGACCDVTAPAISSSIKLTANKEQQQQHQLEILKMQMWLHEQQRLIVVKRDEQRSRIFQINCKIEQQRMQLQVQQKELLLHLLRQKNKQLISKQEQLQKEEADCIVVLNNVNNKRNSKTENTTSKNDTKWMTMFKRLKEYKAKHGDTLVPVRYKDRQLGEWVRQQRRRCKREDRSKLLEDIGFVFIVRPHRGCWYQMFQKLVEYKKQHNGSTRVPLNYKENPELGLWVARQRQLYRKWGISRHRKSLLQQIGFELDHPDDR